MTRLNLAIAALLLLASAGQINAQSYTLGQPLIAGGNGDPATDGLFWDAKPFTGADLCAKIYAAWSAAKAAGVVSAVIDARGLTGPQSCASSPFVTKMSGTLLLGNAVIATQITWQIPSDVTVEGIGSAGPDRARINTIIQAASSIASPVVQLGVNTHWTFNVVLKSVTIDAAGLAAVGVSNVSALEGSRIEDVSIVNASSVGLLLGQQTARMNASGSGPYRNINVQYTSECTNCGGATTGVLMLTNIAQVTMPIRGFDNVTVSGKGTKGGIGTCIAVVGFPVFITNSHVEFCNTGVQIGATDALVTNAVEIENVNFAAFHTGGWDITIQNAADVTLNGVLADGVNMLQDNVTGNRILGTTGTQTPIGLYFLGDGTTPAVISSAPGITWVVPGNLQVAGTINGNR
jgi:hypothetical protein